MALFIEMQCRNNVVTSNRLVAADGGYGLNLNSFLNVMVSNDLGGSNVKISGAAPYPTALSNRFVDNFGIGRFNTEKAGCGNYATENRVSPQNVSNKMALENCTRRPGGCSSPLNRGFGCIDPDAAARSSGHGHAAMLFSDVAPAMPGCTSLGGLWLATGHDMLTVNVSQRGNKLTWLGLGPFSAPGDAYNGSATIASRSVSGTLHGVYKYSKGFHHSTYHLIATLPASCDSIQWLRPHHGIPSKPEPFANWTRAKPARQSTLAAGNLARQLAQNQRAREAAAAEARALEERRAALDLELATLQAMLAHSLPSSDGQLKSDD